MGWKRRLLWALGSLLLLWALAWLAVPPLVKWQVEQRLSDLTGRKVSVGEVSFNPWSLQLSLSELAVAAAEGATSREPQFTLARLHIDADARSLWRMAPVVESLQIEAPRLRVARTGDGRYDIDDILQRLAPRPGDPPGATPRFALYNLELRNGEAVFDDTPVQRQHRLGALALTLPFLSNLPSQVDIKVEPRLAFMLDGAAFDSGAQAVPFARSRSGTLTLRVAALDLEPYLGYLPEALPVRMQRGRIGADLALDFAAPENGEASISVRGRIGASELAVAERSGAPLLAIGQATLGLSDVRPLARTVGLGELRIDGLELHLARDAKGALSIERLLPGATQPAAEPPTSPATAPAATASAAPDWRLSLDAFELADARVLWNDAAVQPASAWALEGLTLSARQLHLPATATMPFTLKATLRPQGDASTTLATLSLEGQASDAAATAKLELSAVSLAAVAPYVNAAARARVAGTGAASGQLEWAAKSSAQAQRILVSLTQLTLEGLKVDEPVAGKAAPRGDTLAAQRLQLNGVALDLAAQSIAVASAKLQRPALRLERSAAGDWNLMRLAGPAPLEESARPLVRAAAEATWQFRLDEFALDDGRVSFVDAAPAPGRAGAPAATVRLGVDRLRFGLRGLQLSGERLVSTPQLQLSARVVDQREGAGGGEPSLVEWRGRFGIQPLVVNGKVRVERFPVHAVQAYVPHDLGLRLARAEAGFLGEVSLKQSGAAGLQLDAAGDVLVSDLMLQSVGKQGAAPAAEGDRELLSWQALAINGVSVVMRPGAVPKVLVREAALSDFFARLILTEEGELNLREVAPPQLAAVAATGAASAGAASSPASAAATPPAAASPPPVELDLGGLRLSGGRVAFSDRFVKPNYSAALTELNGSVGAFRTGSGEPATLQLNGRVAGTGLLEINGRLRPKAVPRELDVTAKATDIELAPLSTYAGKYAGYAIERGKLSVEVHYSIDPDGKLEASHQVVLNQLTFGERVESPTATKLPVLLAVALLKDRNGVIDINLPVSGTLDDPQFSVGPIIWKVIVNLLTKAITAPFALLAGGGGPDMSVVAFQPGTSEPAEGGRAALDRVAKALTDRPALKMTVTGEADPATERDAFQRATLEQRLMQERRREQLRASGAASAPEAAGAAAFADDDERARLVKAVYRQTDLPDKPRNMIGLKADIPTDEMEALLRKHVEVGPEAMRQLALQRGLAVRDAMVAKGLASDRLFLGEPRLHSGGAGDAPWTPQVKLTLDTR